VSDKSERGGERRRQEERGERRREQVGEGTCRANYNKDRNKRGPDDRGQKDIEKKHRHRHTHTHTTTTTTTTTTREKETNLLP
jgi:hypothetical protein